MLPKYEVRCIVFFYIFFIVQGQYINVVKRSQIQPKTSAVLKRIMSNSPIAWKLRSRTTVPTYTRSITVEFTTRSVLRPRTYQFSQNGIVGIKHNIFEDTAQNVGNINSKIDKMDATAIKSNLFVGKLLKKPHAKTRFIRDTILPAFFTKNGLKDIGLDSSHDQKIDKVFKPLSGLTIVEMILKSDRVNPLKSEFWYFLRERASNAFYRLKKYLKGESISHILKATHLWESSYGRSLAKDITDNVEIQEQIEKRPSIFDYKI